MTELILTAMTADLMILQSRVVYQQTRILSGVFKDRKVTRGDNTQLTEKELLQDELDTMKNHINRMQEIHENIIERIGGI
jgi:hypothetical protein